MAYSDLMDRRGLEEMMMLENPFTSSPAKTDLLFFSALFAAFRHHFENNPTYRKICGRRGLSPDSITSLEDIPKIPLVASTFFRSASAGQYGASIENIASMPIEIIPEGLRFTTSGTTAKTPSVYPYDPASMATLMRGTAVTVKNIYGLNKEDNVLFLTCPKSMTGMTQGMRQTLKNILQDEGQIIYAMEELDSPLDPVKIRELLSEKAGKGISASVHIYGPPYAYNEIADALLSKGLTMSLGEGSIAMTTGGWKSHKEGQITEQELKDKIYAALGIRHENHRDGFGLTDIMSFFPQCENGYFHVPPWISVSVRDPEDLYLTKLLKPKEEGQLAFIAPAIGSFPPFIATGDLGTILTPKDELCGCKRYGITFQYKGRIGLPTGCALVQEAQQKGA